MSLLLGVRIAFAGGRESLARMCLMAIGVAFGVTLLMLALGSTPVIQHHIDRLAWHRTTLDSAPTAPDRALWLANTDQFMGRDVIRVHVAALGPRPPLPPGVQRLPGPGEKLVSPGLAELMRTVPDDQLDNRYPGRVVGTIGPEGLIMPAELVAIIGHTPDEMRNMRGAFEIRGIEQPGDKADFIEIWGVLFGLLAALMIGPVIVFVSMVTRIGGVRREERFAAIRLAGGTRFQTAVLAATETTVAALIGIGLGWLAYLAARPVVAGLITLGHGMPIFVEDFSAPTGATIVALVAVLAVAVLTTLVALRPVQMMPLGVSHRARRRPPSAWRLAPIVAGIAIIWYLAEGFNEPDQSEVVSAVISQLTLLAVVSIVVGLFLTGPWLVMWISRGFAQWSRSAITLIVARRIAVDPYTAFRAVSGAALAVFVATPLALTAQAQRGEHEHPQRTVLDPGVVAVHVRSASDASVAPLMSEGVVVARLAPGRTIVVPCADLARVTNLECPLPVYQEGPYQGDFTGESQPYLRLQELFELPYPNPAGADYLFGPESFSEPGPDSAQLPIQTLFIPTDGTPAAQERIRTLAATVVPLSRSKVSEDLVGGQGQVSATGLETVLPYALAFVLLVAACSLTVSVITGVLERRRPFALLRASGVRVGELRRIVLMETGVPLALTSLGSAVLAVMVANLLTPANEWVFPGPVFLGGLAIGVLVAFVVSLLALPFMDGATRYESIRFE